MDLPDFFGLDIGNHSIKIAQIKFHGADNAELVGLGHIETGLGEQTINLQDENSRKSVAEKVIELRKSSGISTNKVVAGLPEALIFSKIIYLPDLPDSELEQAIFYEAKQYLPIPPAETQLDFIPLNKVTSEGKNLLQALLIAAPKTIVNSYLDLAARAGLEFLALETESVATARALSFKRPTENPSLVLDFGAKGVDMSVVKNGKLIFSQSLGTGSDSLTKAIAADFGFQYPQAEEYKRKYGLLPNQMEGKIARSLNPIMQIIVNEINKTINYFRAHLQESTPTDVLIVGDGGRLPGLPEFLSENLGIKTEIVNPLGNLTINSRIEGDVKLISPLGYSVAIGLALKNE